MRPSGKKASRQGSSKLATVVIVKGTLCSGFCSPILTCAHTPTDARVKSNAAFCNFINTLLASHLPEGFPSLYYIRDSVSYPRQIGTRPCIVEPGRLRAKSTVTDDPKRLQGS